MNTSFPSVFGWLLRASWQGAVLALLVLAAQFCLRKRLDGRWRYLLWTLVVVRLALPFSPPSPVSLFNYVRLDSRTEPVAATPRPATQASEHFEPAPVAQLNAAPEATLAAPRQIASRAEPQSGARKSDAADSHFALPNWRTVFVLVWAAGVALLLVRVVWQNAAFCRRLVRSCVLDDPKTLALFHRCKSQMNVHRMVGLVETDAVRSPALYGLFRPRLLLPEGLTERFDEVELKHIFLHELAHVRRRDMLVQRLVMCLQIAHWFNPILWFAFRRMAADREVACDELALSVTDEGDGRSYGKTIIKLLETCSQPPALPGLVGILEDKNQMFQRISMIAQFKKHPRWSIIGIALAAALALATLTGAQTGRTPDLALITDPSLYPNGTLGSDLVGKVTRSDGKPVKATVFIYTAAPKVGTSPLCPSCYADCRKSAKTDSGGNFKIKSLDPKLIFRILVVGEGCNPQFADKVDPAKAPIDVTLEPQDAAEVPADQIVRGRVVDVKGTPIEGASIVAFGIHTREGGGGWGNIWGVDRLAVSDDHGEFRIIAHRPFASLDMKIEARGFAKRTFAEIRGGQPTRDLQLTEGATIKGRVTRDGKPLANVQVGAISDDRSPAGFAGKFDVGTDAEGRFALVNMPPNTRFMVSGLVDTPPSYGATRIAPVDTGGDGTTADAGDLEIGPASRLSGRVALNDGNEIPPETRLLITRKGVTGPMQVELARDGSFDVGVPHGVVGLHVQIAGYHPSVKNVSLDELNPFGLIGRFEHDITNLVLLMDKGPRLESHFDGFANGMDLPENRPLEGAEHAGDHKGQQLVSGRVIDKETGRPIASFRLTPGRSGGFRARDWNPQRAIEGTNGSYAIYLDRRSASPLLKIEASGYLPMASPELSPGRTNYDFAMTKGTGPSGVVLSPDGKPCVDASVLLTCPQNPGAALLELKAGGKFQAVERPDLLTHTDATGHFSFGPQLDMNSVAASAPGGFKLVSVDSLKSNPQITLEPWGRVHGILRRDGKVPANEQLSLQFARSAQDKDLFFGIGTTTDDKGAFEFDQVPPGSCAVNEFQTDSGLSRFEPLQEVIVAAGKLAEMTIDAPARPAAQTGMLAGGRRVGRGFAGSAALSTQLTGTVLLPDGKPAIEAQVGLKLPQQMLHMGDGELVAGMLAEGIARTDGHGAFSIPMPSTAEALYAAHESGYAKLDRQDLTNGVKIVLQRWAKIQGHLKINDQPGANERITLQSSAPAEFGFGAMYMVQSTTDEKGGFEFAHVPAGALMLYRSISTGNGGSMGSYSLHFDVGPGASTNIAWGGTGRPVTGRLDLSNSKDVPTNSSITVSIHTEYPLPPRTDGEPRPLSRSRAIQQWRQTEAGQAAIRAFRDYDALANADGSFRVDDVPPGKYELAVQFRMMEKRGDMPQTSTLMSKPQEIVVPAPPHSARFEAYDLGTIEPEVVLSPQLARQISGSRNSKTAGTALKAGDQAPDFETKTLEEKPLRLVDYRGKFVLLDLRYMLPGAEMEGLEAVNNSFGKDDRFVTISLCEDANDNYIKQTKSKGPNHWVMGELDFPTMSKTYRLDGAPFPMIILIGPDGKIVAPELRGEQIYASVAQALGKN